MPSGIAHCWLSHAQDNSVRQRPKLVENHVGHLCGASDVDDDASLFDMNEANWRDCLAIGVGAHVENHTGWKNILHWSERGHGRSDVPELKPKSLIHQLRKGGRGERREPQRVLSELVRAPSSENVHLRSNPHLRPHTT